MRQGNIPVSSSVTEEMDYIPQQIGIKFGATGAIDRITVTTSKGDVIMNLNDAGFKDLAISYSKTALDLTADVIYVPVATGMIMEPCVIYISTTAGVGGVDWYTTNKTGVDVPVVLRSVLMNVKANANTPISGFYKLCILSMGTSDVCTITSTQKNGGISSQLFKEEFQGLANQVFNNSTDSVIIDNTDQSVSNVNLNPTAERTCVLHQFAVNGATTPSSIGAELAQMGAVQQSVQSMSNKVAKAATKQLQSKNGGNVVAYLTTK